ncbi:hypothetical protein RJ639_014883 [Escallonia herrerae]|uniref:Uncharacterized protein n=1 Tax=Escallonia herrerae TaxID=1293975 RepID=A0AA88UZ04_9ASTE|nr:hypothetical protein RJ639_023392 [Escallonia herrerae]KAK3008939.1 hypothetical protein RJ639_014883 [Escallonia herrerae]
MAAPSPALSNNSTDTATTPIPAAASTSTAGIHPATNTSRNLRGLNKPKCIKCGNVARSRCPYQSCKSCCAKAQNPCHIHVLKGNSTFPEKGPSSGSPSVDQQSTEASPSGNSHRVASLRQLSSNFAQFNNLQSPLRSRKPLSRKDAAVINEWRFLKLKEYKDRNCEAENEAFDRYMQYVTLLEEVFSAKSALEGPKDNGPPSSSTNHTAVEDSSEMTMEAFKLKLRSNPVRTENFRKKMQYVVDQGLRKLRNFEPNGGGSDLINEQDELVKRPKKAKSWRTERAAALSDLADKLNKARNEDDLKLCLEMKAQLFNQRTQISEIESKDVENSKQQNAKHDSSPQLQPDYSPPKWYCRATIDQEELNRIDVHFSSLEEIEDL